jgi:hypothetical protein
MSDKWMVRGVGVLIGLFIGAVVVASFSRATAQVRCANYGYPRIERGAGDWLCIKTVNASDSLVRLGDLQRKRSDVR